MIFTLQLGGGNCVPFKVQALELTFGFGFAVGFAFGFGRVALGVQIEKLGTWDMAHGHSFTTRVYILRAATVK